MGPPREGHKSQSKKKRKKERRKDKEAVKYTDIQGGPCTVQADMLYFLCNYRAIQSTLGAFLFF